MDIFRDIPETPEGPVSPESDRLGADLMSLTEDRTLPWRKEWLDVVVKCNDFKEGKQWSNVDTSALDEYGVPAIPIDRINRGLDTINGIKDNTPSAKKVVKRELGDERVAELIDNVATFFGEDGSLWNWRDQAFDDLKDVGLGVLKFGFDRFKRRFVFGKVNPEDFGWSKTSDKYLSDVDWCWEHQVTSWQKAVAMFPQHASKIKSISGVATSEYQAVAKQSGATSITNLSRDYGTGADDADKAVDDMVHVWDFWVKRVIPLQIAVGQSDLQIIRPGQEMPEGYQEKGWTYETQWWQFVVLSRENKSGAFIAQTRPHQSSKGKFYDWCPFTPMISQRKKSGAPVGYIEQAIPHQIRINLAWGAKVAFNNKSIKSPIVTRNVKDISKLAQQSRFGAILNLNDREEIVNFNTVPNVDLQAIEEGQSARSDMDFAAAATEGPLRGVADASSSGIKLGMQQNAAVTSLNKWTKADRVCMLAFWKKVVDVIVNEVTPEEMMRIVGPMEFLRITGYQWDGKKLAPMVQDPVTGEVVVPVEFPLDLKTAQYDIKIEDQSVSDLNKQTSFNATEALVAGGVLFTDEFRIKNAPLSDNPAAIQSNRVAKVERIRLLEQALNALIQENDVLRKGNPNAQGTKGAAAPQAGKRSMVGGQTR